MQQIILLRNAMASNWEHQFEAGKWCKFTLALIFFTLAACGGSSNSPGDMDGSISAQPVSVLFRPGEIEQVRITVDDASFFPRAASFSDAKTVTQQSDQPCATPGPLCRVADIQSNPGSPIHGLESYGFFNTRNRQDQGFTITPDYCSRQRRCGTTGNQY